MKNLLLTIFFIVLGIYFYKLNTPNNDTIPEKIENTHVNELFIDTKDNSSYRVPINEPIELDFLSKQQVFDVRKKYAAACQPVISKDYAPSETVFGQITDGKPWWGLVGQDYYDPGQHSIDGLSEETRSINNPLLLFMLDPKFQIASVYLDGPNLYPKPISLTYKPSQKTISVVYDISGYNTAADNYLKTAAHENFVNENQYLLQGVNARDFGYDFAYAYSANNILFDDSSNNLSTNVQQLQDFLHTGGSCGYEGGCNNGSPNQPYLHFKTTALPAQLGIRLWKKMPQDKNAPADIYFTITLQ